MTNSEKINVIITGMHRSGTSFLSRALNLCGVDLGPESDFFDSELNPKFGNPRGHWENIKIINLNEEILKANDGTWHNIPNSLNKNPESLEKKQQSILQSFYLNNAIAYGCKDPRFCIIFNKWKKQLPNFVLVGIFRHPLKVAESLKKRDGFDYDKSLSLWKTYNENLLTYLKKFGGFLLDFDWPKNKLLEQTQLIASKIGLASPDLSSWFTESYKFSDKSFEKSYPLPKEITDIHKELKHLSEKNEQISCTIPKISSQQYKMIFSDLINRNNRIYQNTLKEFKNDIETEKKHNLKIIESPIGAIISIFNERKDLQEKFPEVIKGDFNGIIEWASKFSSSKNEGELITKARLSKYLQWYGDYASRNLVNKKIQEEKDQLTKEKDQLTKEKDQLTKEKDQLQEEITKLYNKDENLQQELDQYKKSIDSLSFDLSQYKKELDVIKSSTFFKVARFFGSKIDKISNKKKVLSDIGATVSASKKTIEDEGISSFLSHAKEKISKGELLLQSPIYDTAPVKIFPKGSTKFSKLTHEKHSIKPQFSGSVIVPTNSTQTHLKSFIGMLKNQLGFKNLKIILINSGVDDLSNLEDSTVKILTIKPEEFSHGLVRNLGMKECHGDYAFFLSDDAIPSSDHLFFDMCEVFSQDDKIAVVTARQIPRSDSDLMAVFSINDYYENLDLTEDRIISTDNFKKLNSIQKRRTAQIDDVCSCYKQEIISSYKFDKVRYAEDLNIGVRLVNDGYKIAQLVSRGVIHSHRRPASYYLKRQFVESKILAPLLGYSKFDFQKQGIFTTQDIENHILVLYNSLNHSIESLRNNKIHDIKKAFEIIKKELQKNSSTKAEVNNNNPLDEIFQNFNSSNKSIKTSFLLHDFEYSLNRFKTFLMQTYPNLDGIEDDFCDTLYKLFAVLVGDRLGNFVLHLQEKNSQDNELEKITTILESGV